jgi:hypothetical protein
VAIITAVTEKSELIQRLRHFAEVEGKGIPDEYGHADYRTCRYDTLFATAIALYLEKMPEDRHWLHDLPQTLVDAFSAFRADRQWATLRADYCRVMEGDAIIPDLTDTFRGEIRRTLESFHVSRLMSVLSGHSWLNEKLESYFSAEMHVIDHAWRRFVRVAYRRLMGRIKKEQHRENKGTFGKTILRTYDCAGRVSFTFERKGESMTYVADGGDMEGFRSGPNSPGAPFSRCVQMIDEVTENWDIGKLKPVNT